MKQKSNGTLSLITKDENTLMIQSHLLKLLINFFTSVAEIVPWKTKFSNKLFRNFLSPEINESFMITSTNEEEIYKIIHLSISINLVDLT